MTYPTGPGYLVVKRGDKTDVYPVTMSEPQPYVWTPPEPDPALARLEAIADQVGGDDGEFLRSLVNRIGDDW